MLAENQLPHQLKLLLENPNVLKVGRSVKADLCYLQQGCRSTIPFTGALDLAMLAKNRQVTSTAKNSLADLCANVLHKRLDKNVPERVSIAWENESLTEDQIRYAALDVYASLCIYQALIKIPAPGPLPPNLTPQSPVLLFNDDRTRLIARGSISSHLSDRAFDGINITPTRTVIEVLQVIVPGAIIGTHKKKTLGDFGEVPFHLVCLRSHLRTIVTMPESPSHPLDTPACVGSLSSHGATSRPCPSDTGSLSPDSEDLEEAGIGAPLLDTCDSEPPNSDAQTSDTPESDSKSASDGQEILGEGPLVWGTSIRSRVLKDPFHVFNMFYIAKGHGLRIEFSRALRDAIFIPDKDDRRRITAWGSAQVPPRSWDEMLRTNTTWLWRHCKRTIPPPEQLYPLVKHIFHTYGPLRDAKTSLPLFNSAAWKTAKNILDLIRDGYLSDPPGVALYYPIGTDETSGGLTIYRCVRGTTFTEGGVHTHLRSRLPTSGVSVRHLVACLLDFVLRHNLLVRIFVSSLSIQVFC